MKKWICIIFLFCIGFSMAASAELFTFENVAWGSSIEHLATVLNMLPGHDSSKLCLKAEAPGTICLTGEEAENFKRAYMTSVVGLGTAEGTGVTYVEGPYFYSFIYGLDENGIYKEGTGLIGVRWRSEDDAARIAAAQGRKPDLEVGAYKIWYGDGVIFSDGTRFSEGTMLATSSNEIVYGVTGMYDVIQWLGLVYAPPEK